MKSLKNRLQELESNLTPRQLIMRYVAEMNTFQSMDEWLFQQYQPKAFAEAGERRDNLYAGIKRGVNSKEPGAASRACNKASREFGYLFTLMTWPSLHLDQERYRYLYLLSYCIQSTVSQFKALFFRERQTGQCPILEKEKQSELWHFRERLKIVWVELKGLEACERQLRDRFFDGKPLFFERDRAFLEEQFDITSKLNFLLQDMRAEFCYAMDTGNFSHSKVFVSARAFYESLPLGEDELKEGIEAKAAILIEQAKRDAEIYVYTQENRLEDAAKSFQTMWGVARE